MTEMSREMRERILELAKGDDLAALIQSLKAKYVESWLSSGPEQSVERERLHHMVRACDGLLNEVRAITDDQLITEYKASRNQARGKTGN